MKKIFSMILVFALSFSLLVPSFATEKGLDLVSNQFNSNASNQSSDEFLQFLLDNNVYFEVEDTYYSVVPKNIDMRSSFSMEKDNVNYVETNRMLTKNAIPKAINDVNSKNEMMSLSREATSSDVRMRQVSFTDGEKRVSSTQGDMDNLLYSGMTIIVGTKYAIPGTIMSLLAMFGTPIEQYGATKIVVNNTYFRRDTWFEVLDSAHNFYNCMLISETRETKAEVIVRATDLNSGVQRTNAENYAGIVQEYSSRHNKLTSNINDAYMRYNLGYHEPVVYRYYTGVRHENKLD